MDMTEQALEKFREIVRAEEVRSSMVIEGRTYLNKPVVLLPREVRPVPLELHTLSGLLTFAKDRTACVVIDGPDKVRLVGEAGGDTGDRDIYAIVTLDGKLLQFPFGRYMDPETFIITLQMLTLDSPDRSEILKLVGSVKGERVIESRDDGISQTVCVRQGVAGTSTYTINNPVTLKPYRTFREIDQPESPFLLRARNGKGEDSLPEFALFEADGGSWRLAAVERIRDYLVSGGLTAVIA